MSSAEEVPGNRPGRQLVLVVGVGRSGTSLCTGVLSQLGFRVPQPEVQSDDTNPRGFGEPRWVVDFHTRLLRERRVTVFDSRPAAWTATATATDDDAVYQELLSWLKVQFVGSDCVVVKDPRTGWFLPLWARCAQDLGITVSTLTMLRHPAEVVFSARKAYGTWQTEASRATSWLSHMLGVERLTRDSGRVFVRYDRLLADWHGELNRAGEVLDLATLRGLEPAGHPEIDAIVDPSLHRSRVGWSEVPVPEQVQTRVDRGWERLTRLAEPGGDVAANREQLDSLRADYGRFYGEVEAIAQSSVTAVKPRAKAPPALTPTAPGMKPTPRGTAGGLARRLVRGLPPRYRRRLRRLFRRAKARVFGARVP